MAIIRILNTSTSFRGVTYNENRCLKNEAELISKINFGASSAILTDKEYLELWSNKNKRIKNKQLHAVISAKGKELTKEQLAEIGKEWLKKMGYEDNPSLIYFHKHNDHHHIHIVTSRVDKDGKKINDKFEKERAVRCLNEIEGINKLNNYRNEISQFLRFSFSTKWQFAELLKDSGYKVKIHENGMDCKKGDSFIFISNELIDFAIKRYHRKLEEKQRKKMQGLIFKYAAQLSGENFSKIMRNKFGLQFIFYGKEGTLNGYTIIDFKNKSIYKGSEVFSIKKMTELLSSPENPSFELELIIQESLKKNKFSTSKQLNDILSKYGNIRIENGEFIKDNVSIPMNEKLQGRINYNDRLKSICEFLRPQTELQCGAVAKLFRLNKDDVLLMSSFYPVDTNLNYYKYLIQECLENERSLRNMLIDNNISLVLMGNDFVLVDAENGVVVSGEELDMNLKDIENNLNNSPGYFGLEDVLEDIPEEDIYIAGVQPYNGPGIYHSSIGIAGGGNKKKRRRG